MARDQDELHHGSLSPLALLADGCFLLSLFIILWIQFLRFLKAAIKLFSFLELNVFSLVESDGDELNLISRGG